MVSRHVGIGRARREDRPLITGEATYTDDLSPTETTYAAILRSQYGHARIENVDTSAAEEREGVLAVYTVADLEAADASTAIRPDEVLPGQVAPEYPLLATDVARFAGDPIAVVVAEDRYVAHDALDSIDVDYDRLDAVVDAREALEDGAPTVHDDAPDNLGLDWEFGDEEGAVEEIFESAPHTVAYETHNARLHPDAMEPRAVLADFDADSGELTVRMATQSPYLEQKLLAETLGLPPDRIRVIAPAVGGGFGSKALPYPEQVLVSWASTQLERPVKWVARRTESHLVDHHGRDFHTAGELALDDDGTVLAFRTEAVQNIGAYLVYPTSPAPNYEHLATGSYRFPAIYGHLRGAFTNTSPVAPYRGAGRPEIIYLIERLLDRAADELGIDPAEIRRRNFIPPDAFPYDTPLSSTYDSGDYEKALNKAIDIVDYEAVRERQARLREEGRYLGVGVSSFVENTGTAPGVPESARVELGPDGNVVVTAGTADHGQGHGTAFSMLVADELGVDYDDVEVRAGDTALISPGAGTFGSRSAAVGGSAVAESAREVREKARKLAAERLEAAVEDVEFADGAFRITGAPDRSIGIDEVARLAHAGTFPDDVDVDLEATSTYDPKNYAHSFGTHVAVVEVDPASGEVWFEQYVAVDDCGVQFNPLIVEGQVMGGVAQGIGQALYELAVYDDNGSLLSGSLTDYALPKSFHVPDMDIADTVTPSPHNPTGAKGVGEGGAIAAPPAVVNAVVDALRPLGVTDLEMPLTAETVWRGVRDAGGE